MSAKLPSLNPLKHPPVHAHPEVERAVALVAATFAIRRAEAARKALIQHRSATAALYASQAIVALRVLNSRAGADD